MSIEAPIQGIPKCYVVLTCSQTATSSNGAFYIGAGGSGAIGTEATVQYVCGFSGVLKRVRFGVSANSKNAATVVGFRINGSTVGSTSVNAAATGKFDSGALTSAIASGDSLNFILDTSASGSGSITLTDIIAEIQVLS